MYRQPTGVRLWLKNKFHQPAGKKESASSPHTAHKRRQHRKKPQVISFTPNFPLFRSGGKINIHHSSYTAHHTHTHTTSRKFHLDSPIIHQFSPLTNLAEEQRKHHSPLVEAQGQIWADLAVEQKKNTRTRNKNLCRNQNLKVSEKILLLSPEGQAID